MIHKIARWALRLSLVVFGFAVLYVATLVFPAPLFAHSKDYGAYRVYSDEANAGLLRHTRFEGNLAEVVAHEVAHFNSVHALGFRPHLRQPMWKSEGWAEYQANLAAIRADPDYDLRRRIDVLLNGSYWGGRHGVARSLWESQLLVEFLGEVKGYRLEDLVADEVTEEATRAQMMAWYRENP